MNQRVRHIPVRIFVPVLLLLVAAISSLLFAWRAIDQNHDRLVLQGQQEVKSLVTTLQGILNQSLANADLKSADQILAFTALSANVKTLILTDNDFHVIVSNQVGIKGEQAQWVSGFRNDVATAVLQSGVGTIVEDHEKSILSGFYPIDLPLGKHQLRKPQQGLLYVEYDLSSKIAQMNHVIWEDIALHLLRAFTLVIIAAWIMDCLIFRRLKKVEKAARDFARGDLDARVGMSASDEVGVLASAFDDMARALAEKQRKLALSEQQLLDAQAIAHIGDWHNDVTSGQVTWSPEIYRIFQMNMGVPLPVFERMGYLFTPEGWAKVQESYHRILKDGSSAEADVECITATGEHRHVIIRAKVSGRDVQGNVAAISGTFQDVTERKRQEATLRQSEKRYSELFSSLQEGILSLDKDGYISFVNQHMANMLGYTELNMLGCHIFQFMDQRDAMLFNNFLERRRQGIKETHEFEFYSSAGERIVVMMASTALYDDQGHYAGTISGVMDITQRKLLEEELSDLNAALEMKLTNSH